ncbi:MAG TPA: rhodanese-like domain-containing protein [Candidatus Nanoarchaeia archaeon]|nr:rhodanese-like domain-containing protein [Candidatus Nanoarchaeia archaeon]
MEEIDVFELKKIFDSKENFILLDVRNQDEYDYCKINGSILIPLPELLLRFKELDNKKEIVVHCHHGNRSKRAVEFLQTKDFKNLKNLKGGIDEWSKNIDKSVLDY